MQCRVQRIWTRSRNVGLGYMIQLPITKLWSTGLWDLTCVILFLSTRLSSSIPLSLMAKGSSVQTLYELCKRTFLPSEASPPSSHAIKKLSSLMDTITPAEVGLKAEALEDERGHGFFGSTFSNYSSRMAGWAQPITYFHIYECDSFTIGIFCLPTSSVIPLHDHPGMTVLSKILYGSLHVKSYDWVEPPYLARNTEPFSGPSSVLVLPKCSGQTLILYEPLLRGTGVDRVVKLAKLQTDAVLMAPCQTRILYPRTGGNLHCFTAVTPCAVLDVLAPPYDEAAGRSCTYYRDFPFSSFQGYENLGIEEREEEYAWLEAIDQPDNLYMRSGIYTGPPVQACFSSSSHADFGTNIKWLSFGFLSSTDILGIALGASRCKLKMILKK